MSKESQAPALETDLAGVCARVTKTRNPDNGNPDGTDVDYSVVIPRLPPEEAAEAKSWPVVVRFPSTEDAAELFSRARAGGAEPVSTKGEPDNAGSLAHQVIGLMADALKTVSSAQHGDSTGASEQGSVPADKLITQDSDLLPDRELYLKLARDRAFQSRKHGKKVIARWGDVQAALLGSTKGLAKTQKKAEADDLDETRRMLGLHEKGR